MRLLPWLFLLTATSACGAAATTGPGTAPSEPLAMNETAPEADCEVEVRTSATALDDGSYEVLVLLSNRLDRPIAVSWVAACPGPGAPFEGLPGAYDYGATCQQGACVEGASVSRAAQLPVDGSAIAARLSIRTAGDSCNSPLPAGTYALRANLSLDGAKSCSVGRGEILVAAARPVERAPTSPQRPQSPPPPGTVPPDPCPAMACAYEPCPPGVEPPTGCGAACGCAGSGRRGSGLLVEPAPPNPTPAPN